jgi:hypothetical protein
MVKYESRLLIPITGNDMPNFYTKSGLLIANGYKRIVIGKRGPYIEFTENQINKDSIFIPSHELWRLTSDMAFYIEYRTPDIQYVKIYYQKKTVNYADYLFEHYYVSPFYLRTDDLEMLIKPLKIDSGFSSETFF